MAIIGAILGDISGSRYEFLSMQPKDLNWRECELFTDGCRFTDDTVMTLATKLAIRGDISFPDSYRMMGRRYFDVGYGGMFYNWLLEDGDAYNSFGNGSAMRCSYIEEHFNEEKEVIEWAARSAQCTHDHPEGIKGAVVTAMCVYGQDRGIKRRNI